MDVQGCEINRWVSSYPIGQQWYCDRESFRSLRLEWDIVDETTGPRIGISLGKPAMFKVSYANERWERKFCAPIVQRGRRTAKKCNN